MPPLRVARTTNAANANIDPPPGTSGQGGGSDPSAMVAAGVRFVLDVLAPEWGLKGEEVRRLIGISAKSSFHDLKARIESGRPVKADPWLLERLSHVLGIARALHSIFRHVPGGDAAWIRTPNSEPIFGGRPPLERLLSESMADVFTVRNYLTHQMI